MKVICLLLPIFFLMGCASAPKPSVEQKQKIEIHSIQRVKDRVEWLLQRWRPEEILLVFDIDNTVLATPQNLGSDQWFVWQEKMLRGEEQRSGLVVRHFDQLLQIQHQILSTSSMELVEPSLKSLMANWKARGHSVFAITSRYHKATVPTIRELRRNGIEFSANGPVHGSMKASNASFQSGVFFAARQNKGQLLSHWLDAAGSKIKAVVFVDDHLKNILDVHSELQNKQIHLTAYRYGHEDSNVTRFKYGLGKSLARQQWRELEMVCGKRDKSHAKSLIRALFGKESLSQDDLKICGLIK